MSDNKRDVAIFVQARSGSRRCHNKMLRDFSGSTLIDICLDKLAAIHQFPVYFGAYEDQLLDKGRQRPSIQTFKRSKDSSENHSDPKIIFEILSRIEQKYVCWINPCHPFLSVETILNAVRHFKQSDSSSLTSVVVRKGWFYTIEGEALTNKSVQADTSLADGIYEVAHAFHIYERERMITEGRPWSNTKGDPELYIIPEGEAWDIDTEEQLVMVEALFSSRFGKC
jgi:CMP-N-acetylneuraminic acid synthetase